PALAHTRTIAVSASAFDDTRRESLQQGAVDFIAKPVRLTELLERVQHHLNIEWVYGDNAHERELAAPRAEVDAPAPPVPELDRLRSLASLGDIEGLNAALDALSGVPEYEPFVARLRPYARQFQMTRISALLENLRERHA